MDNTIIQQGKFTSDGNAKVLQIRSDVDWMAVYNYTQAATQQATGRGVKFFWQRGMADDAGIEYKKSNNTDVLNMVALTSGGFSLIDTSANPVGTLNATVTAISNANPPVVSATSTAGLSAGDVVRFIDVTGAQQFGGVDFSIDTVVANTSFRLPFAPTIVAATGGSFRKIKYQPLFYPRRRFIASISQAAQAVVELTVTHQFKVGQQIRFQVPQVTGVAYGMIELDGVTANIVDVDTTNNTITVDHDTSGYTAFAWPLTADVPFTPAQVIPVGEDTSTALSEGVDLLNDATINDGYIGMVLAAGAQSPAGSNSDVIYWVAGKSFSVDN